MSNRCFCDQIFDSNRLLNKFSVRYESKSTLLECKNVGSGGGLEVPLPGLGVGSNGKAGGLLVHPGLVVGGVLVELLLLEPEVDLLLG